MAVSLQSLAAILVSFLVGALLVEYKAVSFSPNIQTTQVRSVQDHNEATYACQNANSTPRPQNLRLVFIGDSVTRYQYLSLAYFLRYGRWFDTSIEYNNLVNSHSFHHPLHVQEDWNEFFLQSTRMLDPLEICDCLRNFDNTVVLERRYFYDQTNNNMMVYLNMNGNETDKRGFYGRLKAESIFGPHFYQTVGLTFGISKRTNRSAIQWHYKDWNNVVANHVGSLNFAYNQTKPPQRIHVLLNAGLHPHNFRETAVALALRQSLDELGFHSTWKTTTFQLPYVIEYQLQQQQKDLHVRKTDIAMCHLLGNCFNVSWTGDLDPRYYVDDLHFLEPVYRIFNEEYLDQIGLLPVGYQMLGRDTVLRNPERPW